MEWEDSMNPTLTLHGQVKRWRRDSHLVKPGPLGCGSFYSLTCITFCSSSPSLIPGSGESPLNHQLNDQCFRHYKAFLQKQNLKRVIQRI